jgi:hypothetical protein
MKFVLSHVYKSFKKSKNKMRSSETAQNWFVPVGTIRPFGGKTSKIHILTPKVL